MSGAARPPLVVALLEAALPSGIAEAVTGDLIEEYRMRARREPAAARAWLYAQVLRSAIGGEAMPRKRRVAKAWPPLDVIASGMWTRAALREVVR